MVHKELRQGFQSLEMKLNSVPSSRGDFAFTTLSFGNLDLPSEKDTYWQQKICMAILNQRMNGEPVVFPKLVMLFSQEQNDNCKLQQELFDKCIQCSCVNLYPDYLAIDTVGEVSDIYRKYGKVVTPMGCRSYLSELPNTNDQYFVGRANIGVVSLNLPMIYMKARETEGGDFYKVLDHYLELARKQLYNRYEVIRNTKASTNPLAFTQGGLKGGYLKPDDCIGDLVDTYTTSFGIAALNELNVLMEGKELHEVDTPVINQVVDYMVDWIKQAKEQDGKLYALYATPAESYAGTQLQQFRNKYGVIEGVSDKEYFTNGFHMPVWAEINPFTKQDKEFTNYHKINGGHIQYSRVDLNKPEIVKGIVLRAMSKGFYSGVNGNLSFCDDCGWSGKETVEHCPTCGSGDSLMEISRVSGYTGFSKQKGKTRFNDSKLAELKDRISM